MNSLDQFRGAMASYGIVIDEEIIADGDIHRFFVQGDKQGTKNGWYILHINSIPAGAFGCFKREISETWCSKKIETLNDNEKQTYIAQIEKIKIKRKEEKSKIQAQARERAQSIWEKSEPASDNHPYLQQKGIKAYGINTYNEALIVPLLDSAGGLSSLQFINLDGSKRFLSGGKISGCYYIIGDILACKNLYISEGYATGATIHQATATAVIIAFNAQNLLSVAEIIRKKYSDKVITIGADNDQWTENNPGLVKANKAAKMIHANVVIPDFSNIDTTTKPTDFNDVMRIAGIEEVKKQLDNKIQMPEVLEDTNKKANITSKVMALLLDVEFFHDEYRDAYATFHNNGHYETWLVESSNFKELISKRYWEVHNSALNKNAMNDVICLIKGKALFDNEKPQQVFTRVAYLKGAIYIHLANAQHEIVKITPSGWEILTEASVKFKINSNMRSLPRPESGGSVEELWELLNIPEKSKKLVIAWILECFRIDTHFPILVLSGIQGSAKSTTQDVLRRFIDPSICNLRSAPRKAEDLLVNAKNNWLVSFNNLSHLNPQQQDDLCSLSTGGGFSTRKLYSTMDEELVNVKRPVVLNGINDLLTQQDVIDRCIIVDLQPISEIQRKTDQELQKQLESSLSRVLGALLTAFSKSLHELPNVKLSEKPRMADFALFGVALEKALGWPQGSFMDDYRQANSENVSMAMEHSPVALSIIQFMETKTEYSGSYMDLYKKLTNIKPDMAGWPKSPKGLANQLKRQSPALKFANIEVTFDPRRRKDGFHINIKKSENNVHQVHHVHQSSTDAAFEGVLMKNDVHAGALCTPNVYPENPYSTRVGVHGVLGELINQKIINDDDREVIVL